MAILIDTNILVAAVVISDANHARASAWLRSVRPSSCVVISPVLNEVFYLVTIRFGYGRAIQTLAHIHASFEIEPIRSEDIGRSIAIMRRYESARMDFVDVAMMAIAERLNITQIATFDHRDFTIIRPSHCDAFTLLP